MPDDASDPVPEGRVGPLRTRVPLLGRSVDRRRFLTGAGAAAAGLALPAALSSCSSGSAPPTSGTGPDLDRVAEQAFLAGVPLSVTTRVLQTLGALVGVNKLVAVPHLVDPSMHYIVIPNRDTIYALAVLDLRAGPQVLHLPDIPDRYHVVQLIDAWMGGFGLLGTRATGGRAGTWVLCQTGWKGALPDGSKRLDCPTAHALVLGRIRAVEGPDEAVAARVAGGITLTPLDPSSNEPPRTLAAPAGTPQSVGTNGIAFFDELCTDLVDDPPVTASQRAAITAAAPLGVRAGARPSTEATPAHRAVLARAVKRGRHAVDSATLPSSKVVNGWSVNLDLGTAATTGGLLQRAVVATSYWGPVPAAEAVYPLAVAASDGKPLDGSKRYRIHFSKENLPPVKAFWSLTVYGPDHFLYENPAGVYSISGDTPGLVRGDSGSIDVVLAHDRGAAAATDNWLPTPAGPYTLVMRLYLPEQPILDGTYDYPTITVL